MGRRYCTIVCRSPNVIDNPPSPHRAMTCLSGQANAAPIDCGRALAIEPWLNEPQHVSLSGCMQIACTPYTSHSRIYAKDSIIIGQLVYFGHYVFGVNFILLPFVLYIVCQIHALLPRNAWAVFAKRYCLFWVSTTSVKPESSFLYRHISRCLPWHVCPTFRAWYLFVLFLMSLGKKAEYGKSVPSITSTSASCML